jgi:hypothetical protein
MSAKVRSTIFTIGLGLETGVVTVTGVAELGVALSIAALSLLTPKQPDKVSELEPNNANMASLVKCEFFVSMRY